MTVSSTGVVVSYEGNGVSTVFAYNFEIPTAADVSVYLTNKTTGVITALTPTQYAISGLGVAGGGNVTYNPASGPLPAGYRITVERVIALLQPSVIPDQGSLFASTVEDALDRQVMMIQALQALQSRTIRAPMSDDALSDLPNQALRALMTLGFDADGDVLVGAVATAIIAAALLPVVQAASTAAAITALFTGNAKIGAGTILTGTAIVDLASVAAQRFGSGTIAVPGAVVGDVVLGVTASGDATTLGGVLSGKVSAADTVTFFYMNGTAGAIDPASQTYTARVLDVSTLV